MSDIRVTHVLYGGLGGHAAVVFDIVNNPGLIESLVLLSPEPPLKDHTDLASALGLPWAWVRADGKRSYPFRMWRALKAQRPEVVVVHSAGAALVALAMRLLPNGPRVVYVEHHSWPLRDRTMNLASMAALMAADAVVALTDEYANNLIERFPRLPHRHIRVIPNGVDTNKFAPCDRGAADAQGPVIIGMQSRLTAIKDHRTLLFAMRQLIDDGYDARLRIAGDGAELAPLRDLQRELGLSNHVEFLGLLNQQEIVKFLQELDIYVHATLGEASSTAILQAMGTRLPIIASAVSGVTGMVRSGSGRLVPPRDASALAEAIKSFIDSPTERRRACTNSRRFAVTWHDRRRVRALYVELQRSVAGGGTRKRVSRTWRGRLWVRN